MLRVAHVAVIIAELGAFLWQQEVAAWKPVYRLCPCHVIVRVHVHHGNFINSLASEQIHDSTYFQRPRTPA